MKKSVKLKKYQLGGNPPPSSQVPANEGRKKVKTKEYSENDNYVKKVVNGRVRERRTVGGFLRGAPTVAAAKEFGAEASNLFNKKLGGSVKKSKKK